ncbi:hypothetical protein QA600_07475 [Natronococcus sp. A-GB1]|uniref:hypothetical protein n=1 Tax=Natronococcus sp. A-GB1 TaxID=3037648 RepID=UPI00241DD344|nr:hypothetical protein [Natronococcus sp. A-GB1]MDG5759180.1 hypothetical protein [Natronococcus sp. A-GB1]
MGKLAGLFIGASAIVGSGAFSSVRTDRSFTAVVEDDPDAYLSIDSVSGGGRAVKDGGVIRFTLPGVFEEMDGLSDASGLGTNSTYEFADDAAASGGEGLFEVKNNGTNTVEVYFKHEPKANEPRVEVFSVADADRDTLNEKNSLRLEPGHRFRAGLRVHTDNVTPDRYQTVISTISKAVD